MTLKAQKWRVPGLQRGNTPKKHLKNKGSCVGWKVAKPHLTQEPTHVAMPMRPPQCIRLSASIMASAIPAASVRGTRTSALKDRGVQGLRCHAEGPHMADAVIEAMAVPEIAPMHRKSHPCH